MSNAPWGGPPPAAPYPGHRPPSRGYGPLILALSLGLALVLVGTIGAVHWLSGPVAGAAGGGPVPSVGPATPPATSTTPTSSPSRSATAAPPTAQATTAAPKPKPKPSTSPSTPAEPRTPNISLKKNTIYTIDLSGSVSCKAKVRRPKPPLKNSALAPYVRSLVSCFVKAFRGPLAKQGFTLATPKVKTYKGSVKTPCGKLGSRSNPAFYCAGTIYWPVTSDDGREAYTFARLGYVGLAAHEFGHHLQATTGILYEYGARYADEDRKGRYALSRRLELQAQCFEGVYLSYARKSLKLSSRDRSEIRAWHGFTGDEDPPSSRNPDHGTSRAQLAWLNKGLDGADFGRCNTWSASSKSVK